MTLRNTDRFVRFANMLVNDATYLLDESLSKLASIKSMQTEMADRSAWEARDATERQEREQHLRQTEGQATSYITLGKSTVELLKLFTAEATEAWMMPEIVERLAAMLDFNLTLMTGSRSADLNVEGRDKYRFDPKRLLSDILAVFINLSGESDFVRAVALDERSYSLGLFQRAAGIAKKRSLKSEVEIEKLRIFVVQVEETKATIEVEEEMGDVPDEFMGAYLFVASRGVQTDKVQHVFRSDLCRYHARPGHPSQLSPDRRSQDDQTAALVRSSGSLQPKSTGYRGCHTWCVLRPL